MCCYTAVVAAAVRHRVPGGKNCRCGSLPLMSSVFFVRIIQTQCNFNVRTPWQHGRICSIDSPITDNTCISQSPAITGMRGAKAGYLLIYLVFSQFVGYAFFCVLIFCHVLSALFWCVSLRV